MIGYTEKQLAVKADFFRERGRWKWNDTWEAMLRWNPELLAGYSKLSSVPHKRGGISPKEKELIYVAIDDAITHYYMPGFQSHLRHGIRDLGITEEEIMEVLVLTSTLGASTYLEGIPILAEELRRRGKGRQEELSAAQKDLKARFLSQYGYWNEALEESLMMDEEMFAWFLAYMEAGLSKHALGERMRELILIAVNISPTALNQKAAQIHIRRTLEIGVAWEEILEVFEMVSCLGIHSLMAGIPEMKKLLEEGA